jgi:hypothetical protein
MPLNAKDGVANAETFDLRLGRGEKDFCAWRKLNHLVMVGLLNLKLCGEQLCPISVPHFCKCVLCDASDHPRFLING